MSMMIRIVVVLCGLVISTASADTASEELEDFGKAVFSEVERKLILDYYNSKYGSGERSERYDEGRADSTRGKKHKKKYKAKGKPGGLPPGIAKKLERGGELPPGIAKKQLPTDLANRLPPVRAGFERAEIDGEVVLIEIASQQIADVLKRSAKKVSRELFDVDH